MQQRVPIAGSSTLAKFEAVVTLVVLFSTLALEKAITWFYSLDRKQRRTLYAVVVAIVGIVGSVRPAHAIAIFQPITDSFSNNTGLWMTNALGIAAGIAGLVGLLSAISAFMKAIPSRSPVVVLSAVAGSVATWIIPTALIVVVMPALINGNGLIDNFAQPIASKIVGLSLQSPDVLLGKFSDIAWRFPVASFALWNASPLNLLSDPRPSFMALVLILISLVMAVLIIAVGALLAVDLFLVQLLTTFAFPLVIWTIGFTASPGTAGLGAGNYSAALKIVARYVVTCAIAAVAINLVGGWDAQVASSIATFAKPGKNVDVGLLKTLVQILIGVGMLAVAATRITALVDNALSGTPAFTGGGAAAAAGGTAADAGRSAAFGSFVGGKSESMGEALMGGMARGGIIGAAAAMLAYKGAPADPEPDGPDDGPDDRGGGPDSPDGDGPGDGGGPDDPMPLGPGGPGAPDGGGDGPGAPDGGGDGPGAPDGGGDGPGAPDGGGDGPGAPDGGGDGPSPLGPGGGGPPAGGGDRPDDGGPRGGPTVLGMVIPGGPGDTPPRPGTGGGEAVIPTGDGPKRPSGGAGAAITGGGPPPNRPGGATVLGGGSGPSGPGGNPLSSRGMTGDAIRSKFGLGNDSTGGISRDTPSAFVSPIEAVRNAFASGGNADAQRGADGKDGAAGKDGAGGKDALKPSPRSKTLGAAQQENAAPQSAPSSFASREKSRIQKRMG